MKRSQHAIPNMLLARSLKLDRRLQVAVLYSGLILLSIMSSTLGENALYGYRNKSHIEMAHHKENLPPPLPLTSTPGCRTPVKRLPSLNQTPIAKEQVSDINSGKLCFICGSGKKRLCSISCNVSLPGDSPVLQSLKTCFSVNLSLGKEFFKMKICNTCKNTLEKVASFKDQVDSAVAAINHIDDSLGCTLLSDTPSEPSIQRSKRMVPTDSTPTSRKTQSKRACSRESQRSLSFSSDHSYSSTSTPLEEARSLTKDRFEMYDSLMTERPISDDDRLQLESLLSKPKTSEQELAATIYQTSVMRTLEGLLIREINNSMVRLCSEKINPGPSVLRTLGNPKDLQEKDLLSEAVRELKREQPFLCRLLTVLSDPPGGAVQRTNTHHVVAMIYGMLMYNRNRNLNALQKLNTAAAIRHHANNDLLEILHRCGITLASSYKLGFLDRLGRFNTAGLVRSIRRGQPGKLTIDNIDGLLKARQVRLGSGNTHYHYTASTYYPDRCHPDELAHLSWVPPVVPDVIDNGLFYLSPVEEAAMKKNYGYQIGRLLVRFCPELKWMEKCIPTHIPHEFSEVMTRKSEIYPLKIILQDPKYLQQCQVIIEELLALLKSCYEEAGQLDEFERAVIPLGGDQLVRVRATGARDLCADEDTREGRLEPVFPDIIEFFHIQQDFLEKMVLALYKTQSKADPCSLPFFKNELDRKNVNGKVKGKYQAHNDFIHTVGSALLLKLSMDKMAMETADSKPNVPGLPENIARKHVPARTDYFEQMMAQIVDEIYKPFTPPEPGPADDFQVNVHIPGRGNVAVDVNYARLEREDEVDVAVNVEGRIHMVRVGLDDPGQDDVQRYCTQLLQWYIHLLEFEDAIKEGDIVRCNICLKMMIPFFYGHSTRSKYAVECIDYILKTEAILPAALAVRCRLGSFTNPHGKPGENKPTDMQQENNILVLKDVIKGLGAGKTKAAMVRASLAAPVTDAIAKQYKEILGIHTRSGRHVDKSDDTDVRAALNCIHVVEPFRNTPGRRLAYYRRIKDSAFARIDKVKYVKHLTAITNRLKRGLEIDFDLIEAEAEA